MNGLGRQVASVLVCGVAATGGAGVAQEAASGGKDFTFHRVKVSSIAPGERRIRVQIDPAEQARLLSVNPAVPAPPETPHDSSTAGTQRPDGPQTAPPGPGSSYAWYWDLLSPDLSESRSGRMETAVAALGQGPGQSAVHAPRLATLQRIADLHGAEILKATVGTGVSPALVLAVIAIESSGNATAVSHAGATGLMQLMPATAERFGVSDRTDPSQSIRGGVAYLDWLLDHFERDPLMALAAYNAGENAVRRHGGVPPYAETRDYVPKVVAAWSVAKGLCMTPPQLVSDGCVFRRGVRTARAGG